MGRLPVVKGHSEVVKSLNKRRVDDDRTIQRGIGQGIRSRIAIFAGHGLFGILDMVLAVSTFTLPWDVVIMLPKDRRNRAVTSETLNIRTKLSVKIDL